MSRMAAGERQQGAAVPFSAPPSIGYTFDDALSLTPKLYRRSVTRERSADGHGIVSEKSKTSNTPWWEKIQMQREYAEMLLRPEWGWSWFGHLTFRNAVHPEAAEKVFKRWVHGINREIFGVRYWNRKERDGVLWARGSEMQKREVMHFHFLMARVPDSVNRLRCMDAWNELAGYARIHPFESSKGAEYYVVKYAAKGGEVDFGGPLGLMHNRLPQL